MDHRTVPRPRAIRLDGLQLSPTDAFVLSRIDGVLTLEEVAEITGVMLEEVLRIAARLAGFGAIEIPAEARASARDGRYATVVAPKDRVSRKPPAAPPPSPRQGSDGPPTSRRKVSGDGPPTSRRKVSGDGPPTVRRAAKATADSNLCELDEPVRARIDAALLEEGNHYAVLGLPRTASRKDIQRAYFAIAATLHPDRHFGKQLGPYKKKLEKVFRRATEAYEALGARARREAYDATLEPDKRTVRIEIRTEPPPEDAPPSSRRKTRPAPPRSSDDAPPSSRRRAATSPPPAARSLPPIIPAQVNEATNVAPARPPPVRSKAAAVLEAAHKALAAGDGIAAANHFRLALHHAEDAKVRGHAEAGLGEARTMIVELHLKNARQEERAARWTEAASSYGKALEGRPDDPLAHVPHDVAVRRSFVPRGLRFGSPATACHR